MRKIVINNIDGKIYKVTNILNGKIYIGKCVTSIEQRFNRHLKASENKNDLTHFHLALKKYGKDNFTIELIEGGIHDKSILCEREKYWIEFYKSYNTDIGYNLTKGGNGGGLVGDALERMRKSKQGHKQSKEQIEKRIAAFKEHAANVGEKNGMYGKEPWNKGKVNVYTEEQINSIKQGTSLGLKKSKKFQDYLQRRKENMKRKS